MTSRWMKERAAALEGEGGAQRLDVRAAALVLATLRQRHHAREQRAVSVDGLVRKPCGSVVLDDEASADPARAGAVDSASALTQALPFPFLALLSLLMPQVHPSAVR